MSYHGTHVVVIEIPEGSWGAGVVWDEVVSRHLLLLHLSLKMDHHNEHIVC